MVVKLDSLKELRRKRKQWVDRHKGVVMRLEERADARLKKAEDDGTDVDQDAAAAEDKADTDDMANCMQQIAALDTRISRVEDALDLEAEGADGGGDTGEDPDIDGERGFRGGRRGGTGAAQVRRGLHIDPAIKRKLLPGDGFVHFMLSVGHAKHFGMPSALKYAKSILGNPDVEKALASGGQSTGGALVPQQFVADLIELLRANVVVRKAGARTMDMAYGNLTIPRLAGGATSGYQDELDDIGISQETFDDVQFTAKKLTSLVPVSNDLIRRSAVSVEQIVREDLVESIARREDLAFLLGAGTLKDPIGILNMGGSTVTGGAATLVGAIGTLNSCELTLKAGNSRMLSPVWIFHPAVEMFLKGLTDQVGHYFFREEMERGMLNGYPYMTTTQFPTNLQTDGHGSYIYFVDFADIIIGDAYTADVEVSYEGAYTGTDGTMVSAFQRDQTIFRIIREHDIQPRHLQSIVVASIDGWVPGGWTGFGAGAPYTTQPLNTTASSAQSANPTG
jgi:HK97 family phage major capsid protein